jgi:SHS2 domain-containing protein
MGVSLEEAMPGWLSDAAAGYHSSWGRMTMSDHLQATVECHPHERALTLHLHGKTLGEILEEGGLALGGLLLHIRAPCGDEEVREIVLDAPDRAMLLAKWLNALIHLAQRDRWVPTRIDLRDVSETHLRARARGQVCDHAPASIPAVTAQNVSVGNWDGAWHAEVLLDV